MIKREIEIDLNEDLNVNDINNLQRHLETHDQTYRIPKSYQLATCIPLFENNSFPR